MSTTSDDLRRTVTRAAKQLLRMTDDVAGEPLAAGKWSPKEVLGHLIDSASNNHQRFVRAQLEEGMIFAGYEQNAWVTTQRYDAAPWHDLVSLWRCYNDHIARVMAAVPEEIAARPRVIHNLHEVAWESPRAEDPVTLAFFMQDYVNHLKHHLRQIHVDLSEAPTQQLGGPARSAEQAG